MKLDAWPTLDRVLWQAREEAFPAGEFVGQESFVSASEILWLAERAGVGAGVSVLDLCCGTGGPGLFLTRALGCDYLGVDAEAGAVARARQRVVDEGVDARFDVASVPPLPEGPFDVVLLLETLLAFRDKGALLRGVADALPAGGRFAFTVEEGRPLDAAERAAMPGADTVWLVPVDELRHELELVGLKVGWLADRTDAHRVVVDALVDAYAATRSGLDGPDVTVVDELVAGHRLWSRWMRGGRVRKLAVVAEKVRA